MRATVFGKLLTHNEREEFKWYLRNKPWYPDAENLETLFQIFAYTGFRKKYNGTYIKLSFVTTRYLMR